MICLDMYALNLGPSALMIMHTYQVNHSCTCYIYNMCNTQQCPTPNNVQHSVIVINTCGIPLTSIVTMVMKVLHNIYSIAVVICIDMYALALEPASLGLVHTYQANHSCTLNNVQYPTMSNTKEWPTLINVQHS